MLQFFSLPHRLLFLFAFLLLGVAAYTAWDSTRRERIEGIVLPSALGDENLYPLPAAMTPGSPIVSMDGQTLFLAHDETYRELEWLMLPVGCDDSGQWMVYREVPRKGDEIQPDPDLRFLKTGPREFLVLGTSPEPARDDAAEGRDI